MSLYDGGSISLSEFGAMHGWASNSAIDLGWVKSNCKWAYNDFNSYRNMVMYQKNNSGSTFTFVDSVPVWVGWYYLDTNPMLGVTSWSVANANIYYRKSRYAQNCSANVWAQCWNNCNCSNQTASPDINVACSQCDVTTSNCDTRWWYQPNCNCFNCNCACNYNPLYDIDNCNCDCV